MAPETKACTYLLLGVTVAAHGPQVLQSSPQEDDEETPEESDHGGGEESPPHPLAVAVTGHIWRERDDHVHLGYVDVGVRVQFLPGFRHFRLFFSSGHLPDSAPCLPLPSLPPSCDQPDRDSGASGSSSQRPLMPQRLGHVKSTTSRSSAFSSGFFTEQEKLNRQQTR